MSAGNSFVKGLEPRNWFDMNAQMAWITPGGNKDDQKAQATQDITDRRRAETDAALAAEEELRDQRRKRRGRASTLLADADELSANAPELTRASLLGETWKS